MNAQEIKAVADEARKQNAEVFVGYNRRYYASVIKAQEIIKNDGGLSSFHFEFTEWAHTIEPLKKAEGVKESWLLANSTHVIDLAFFLGGKPSEMSSFTAGKLSWHDRSVFAGAGKTAGEKLFSYNANWEAPGRWGLELMTTSSRLVLRPLEGLLLQQKGSVAIVPLGLDDTLDKDFKPGLYLQNKSFLEGDYSSLITIAEQAEMVEIYGFIAGGGAYH
jgi:predicted dehydrogenase